MSSDFDLTQLVDDMFSIDVLSPHAGKVFRTDDIIAKFGVPPSRVAHFKALAGDKSDNYQPFPGPMLESGKRGPGIGDKSAMSLLAKFGHDAMAAVRACCAMPPPEGYSKEFPDPVGGIPPNIIKLIRWAGGREGGPEKAARDGLGLASLRTNLPALDFAPVLLGPAPVQRITNDANDGPPEGAPGVSGVEQYGDPSDSAAAHADFVRLAEELGKQGVRMVPSSHPMGTPQGPISAALQVAQERPAFDGAMKRPSTIVDRQTQQRPADRVSFTGAPVAAPQDSKGAATPGAGSKAPSAVQPHATGPAPSSPDSLPGGEGAAEGSGHVLRSDGVVEPSRAAATGGEAPKRAEVPSSALVAPGPNERFVLSPYGLEPGTMNQALWLAKQVCEARVFTKFGTPEAILVVILMGRTRGFGALTSLENAYTVGGQVAWKSGFIVGTVMASGAAEYLAISETDAEHATAVTKRVHGGIGREQALTFTIEEARKMGYLNQPKEGKQESSWLKQPAVMLRWRALVALARMVFPDVAGGMYDKSEISADGHMNDEEMGQ